METLYLKDLILDFLPNDFVARGNLDLSDSNIILLPDKIKIFGDLILGNCKLKKFPSKAEIIGNIYIGDREDLIIPEATRLGGRLFYKNGDIKDIFIKGYKAIFIDNKKITYYKEKILNKEVTNREDFWYPEVKYYKNIFGSQQGVSYKENNKEYFLICTDAHNAYEVVNIDRAKRRGVFEKYSNYDLNKIRSREELIEIYKDCTQGCDSGILTFINTYCEEPYEYSLSQIREKIINAKLKLQTVEAVDIFLDLFKQKEAD